MQYSRPKDFLGLLCQALPPAINREQISACAPIATWEKDGRQACEIALRNCALLDWDAYLANYPDVAKAGVDPRLHFLQYGIYEGRQLFAVGSPTQEEATEQPQVAVIIPNFNNEKFLARCIRSVQRQTLRDIEIIAVDDKSTDGSLRIMRELAAQDPRIKLIEFSENKSQHMARIAGIAAASASYIMFLDADDYLEEEACARAVAEIRKGHDIVCFGTRIMDNSRLSAKRLAAMESFLNRQKELTLKGDEILNEVFYSRNLSPTLWNKIYRTRICKTALAVMEEGYYSGPEDLYQFLAIAASAGSLRVIPDKLYNYNFGAGVTATGASEAKIERYLKWWAIFGPIRRFCENSRFGKYLPLICTRLIGGTFFDVLSILPESKITTYIANAMREIGALDFVTGLIEAGSERARFLAKKIAGFAPMKPRRLKRVGIYHPGIAFGGTENSIRLICGVLLQMGLAPCLFLTERHQHEIALPEGVEVFYLQPPGRDKSAWIRHIRDFHAAVVSTDIDLMLHVLTFSPLLFWQTLLLHGLGIPIIGWINTDFNFDLLRSNDPHSHNERIEVWKCLDKVVVLSREARAYFRARGIDAELIPNPAPEPRRSEPAPENLIGVICRMSDPLKQVRECLRILKESLRLCPDAKMLFIGDFKSYETRVPFYETARELDLLEQIRVTGWTDKPSEWLGKCRVMLSASLIEGFGYGIAEALAMGIPCVVYDVNSILLENNEAVKIIPQGDLKGAAAALAEVLTDEDLQTQLGRAGISKMADFGIVRFSKRLAQLFATYARQSRLSAPDQRTYRRIINLLEFYINRPYPKY